MSTVGVELTNSCPWRCQTCLPASGLPRTAELDPARWQYLLRLLADLGYRGVCFSGGEPLTHPAIAQLLTVAAEAGLGTSLFTSGSGLNPSVLEAVLATQSEVVVSLDGAEPDLHDQTRGVGSFDTAVNALAQLQAAGARSSISCTVTLRNRHALDRLPELALTLGAERLTFNEVVYGGRARRHWSELGLDAPARAALRRWFQHAAPRWPGGEAGRSATDESCWVDGSSLYINSQGRCYLCSEVAQFRPRNRYGTIVGEPATDTATIARIRATDLSGCSCRYETVVHGPYLLVLDSPRPCVGLDRLAPGGAGAGTPSMRREEVSR